MTEPHEPGPLTRTTVNLIAKSVTAIDEAAILDGLSRTDVVNRAVQLYAYLRKAEADGDLLYLAPTGDLRRAERVVVR
jgi:hypothetical protein